MASRDSTYHCARRDGPENKPGQAQGNAGDRGRQRSQDQLAPPQPLPEGHRHALRPGRRIGPGGDDQRPAGNDRCGQESTGQPGSRDRARTGYPGLARLPR